MGGFASSGYDIDNAMKTDAFNFFTPQRLVFGAGTLAQLPGICLGFGRQILVVTGKSSFLSTPAWQSLEKGWQEKGCGVYQVSVSGEPCPDDVDSAVAMHRNRDIDMVVAIGGGSVLDAGKAISAMMCETGPVMDFLEGVGTCSPDGKKLPFIAVPTTSGTGSEATKNAVISRPGPDGFKKSLRHNNFVPDIAVVDPALTLTCPPDITAACGMDALTQLLEAYVSVKASPVTDALCLSGLKDFGPALLRAVENDPEDIHARTRLSYGAYMSGLALANAGLGTVHGFASVIGGLTRMSHGHVCGTLLAETTKAVIDRLGLSGKDHPGLARYAAAAKAAGLAAPDLSHDRACTALIDALFLWTEKTAMPGLGAYGITKDQVLPIAQKTGQKNTPARLGVQELAAILEKRI
ncbi:MAG: iron-containing alcohol dehydrogenase [Desulfobacter sp.]